MTPGEYIELLVSKNTIDDHVNIIGIAKTLNIKIYQGEFKNIADLAKLKRDEYSDEIAILLNERNDSKHNHTLIALLIAEYILHPEKANKHGFSYDVFSLREVRVNRFSQIMMLATRLAIPENIISKIDELGFDIIGYANKSKFLPEFIKSTVKAKNLSFLVNNGMTGVLNLSK